MTKFRESMSEGTRFGEDKKVYISGGPDMPEPIGLKLVPLYKAFDVNYYQVLDQQGYSQCNHSQSLLETRKIHLIKILNEYPRLKNAHRAVGKIFC